MMAHPKAAFSISAGLSLVLMFGMFPGVSQAKDAGSTQMTTAPNVPPPIKRSKPAKINLEIETREFRAEIADGVEYEFWTFGDSVPGPFIRIRQGDSIHLTLKNNVESRFPHSIDLHAVTGPGGGAKVTQTLPGETKSFLWKALNPGLYIYHCATPHVPTHIANGMYGLILVEPPGGLPAVDREFYVVQGDFYTEGSTGEAGYQAFSLEKSRKEQPDYVLFNGRMGALIGKGALKAKVGETVRLYIGNGGPNLISSFHVIGEIFDRVYPEGAVGRPPAENVQTTLVPAGGAAIVEFKIDVPGKYILVDHALSRAFDKGGIGFLDVEGPKAPKIFKPVE